MKAITLTHPWDVLIAAGACRYSIRSWHTRHRGPLALYCGRSFSEDAVDLCLHPDIAPLLARAGFEYIVQLPLRAVVGVARLVECVRIRSEDEERLDKTDLALRHVPYISGNWAWVFARPRLLKRPVPFNGRPGLFTVPDHLLKAAGARRTTAG
jgi:hypothetical protein